MNIHNSGLPEALPVCFALGNTPPVCLTQDLPPELDADILLLGCGDARNVLFTCFADNARKIDVTCCDIEPMIHARNVLLYTLLIDDKSNKNVELIWNIYYHWKIDGNSLKFLESQTEKILRVSDSVEQWNSSEYGSSIRFCDEQSLSSVKCHWLGFTSQGLSPDEKQDRLDKLQAAINRAKANRVVRCPTDNSNLTGYQSLFPTNMNPNEEVLEDLCQVTKYWWDLGVLPSSNSPSKHTHLNPVFLYSPNHELTIYQGVTPLAGIPLNTAYISVQKGSAFCVEKKGSSSVEHLVNCAKNHFLQWALAFRKTMRKGSVIRVFSGHAFAFCFTLRNCQQTGSTEMNLFCHNWTNSPLILHPSDYGRNSNAAPLSFDVIDTSNLTDYFGPLNVVALASSLLKHQVSSCLYTQLMIMFDYTLPDRINDLFGVDIHSMSLLLGLVPPDLFTNATNTVEEYPNICKASDSNAMCMPLSHSRLRWRRFGGSKSSPRIQVEAEELAKFLIQVYNAMFKLDNSPMFGCFAPRDLSACRLEMFKLLHRPYNRASFAFLLSILKATIIVDWDKCLKEIYNVTTSDTPFGSDENRCFQDLLLNLHIFGIDSSLLTKPNPADTNGTILASLFPTDLPEQLCVTVRVPREHRKVIAKMPQIVGIFCSFEARDPNGKRYDESFSSVQIAFGKWHEQTEADNSYPYIEEDRAQVSGALDMFASVMVPTSMLTSMLLQSEQFVPIVKFKLKFSMLTFRSFHSELGQDLCFFSTEITSKDVFITRFMPGMSGHPTFTIASNQQDKSTSTTTVVRFSDGGSKINALVKRITLESEAAKTTLAMKTSTVEVEFNSPFGAVVSIGGSLKFKLEFPVPVSVSKYKVRVARKSSYVEVEAGFFDPVEEAAPSFFFPYFLTKTPCGTVPVPWTSTRVDLDIMPLIDLNDTQGLSLWLTDFVGQMFSRREYLISLADTYDLRVGVKGSLMAAFTFYLGLQESRWNFFSFEDMDSSVKFLILPSCLRLNLANYSVALDSALIPFTNTVSSDPIVTQFLKKLEVSGLFKFRVTEAEIRAWNVIMPALVERCRSWSHTSRCEYCTQADEVLLLKGLNDVDESPICSCGIGKFPTDYLKDQMKGFSALDYTLTRYATRIALSPIFAIPYVEDCDITDLMNEICSKCNSDNMKLLKCSRCKMVQYCSANCQKADWKKHKPFCKAA